MPLAVTRARPSTMTSVGRKAPACSVLGCAGANVRRPTAVAAASVVETIPSRRPRRSVSLLTAGVIGASLVAAGVAAALVFRGGRTEVITTESVSSVTMVVVRDPVPADATSSPPTKNTVEAPSLEGTYAWTVTAADLPGRSSRYIAENTGDFGMTLRSGRWELTQDSPTAQHTTLVGRYGVHGNQIRFTITGPGSDSQVGQSFSARWLAATEGLLLSDFSSPGWGGVLGAHRWTRL